MKQRDSQHDGRQAKERAGLLHDVPSVTNRGTGPWSN